MSQDLLEKVEVKEEILFEPDNASDANDPLLAPDSTRKCGEVFFGHQGGFTFVCSYCLQACADMNTFGDHLRDVHTFSANPKSPARDEKKDVDLKLESPVQDENDTETLDCDDNSTTPFEDDEPQLKNETRKRAKTKSKLKEKKSEKYFCYACGREFSVHKDFREHYRKKHADMIEKDDPDDTSNPDAFVPKIPKVVTCRYCLSSFDQPVDYQRHMQTMHPGLKKYTCPRCPRTFRNKNMRDYHFDTHDGNKQFKCPHCPKAFTHPNNLQTHINIHLNIKPYACQFCDYRCTQKAPLKIHERIHTKEKPFQCDECGKSFIAQVMLTNHTRKHKNIRNYKCPYCEKAFFTSKDLVKHKRIHTNETPFECDICGRKFKAEGTLRTHKQLHAAKKYECKICGKMFAQCAGLYSHMKSHGELKAR